MTDVIPCNFIAPSSPSSSSLSSVADRTGAFAKGSYKKRRDHISLVALIVTFFRKPLILCQNDKRDIDSMDIGVPTNIRHVAHVIFDRFNGFLGLPVEFQHDVPNSVPSASATVFGVSTESMQLSYDSEGNSVPTVLLLMQSRLYQNGGLQAEGIFRINADNSQEEYVRNQLNRGVLPEGVDVHCLAGLIKAWFRELPSGILDSLSPEQLLLCETEEHCLKLIKQLRPSNASLLNWAVNMMADVVRHEQVNKMNARNVALVFAPNMTQVADPETALDHAVKVMNFLRMLIQRALRERKHPVAEASCSNNDPDTGHPMCSLTCDDDGEETEERDESVAADVRSSSSCCSENSDITDELEDEVAVVGQEPLCNRSFKDIDGDVEGLKIILETRVMEGGVPESPREAPGKLNRQLSVIHPSVSLAKVLGMSLSRVDSRQDLVDCWR